MTACPLISFFYFFPFLLLSLSPSCQLPLRVHPQPHACPPTKRALASPMRPSSCAIATRAPLPWPAMEPSPAARNGALARNHGGVLAQRPEPHPRPRRSPRLRPHPRSMLLLSFLPHQRAPRPTWGVPIREISRDGVVLHLTGIIQCGTSSPLVASKPKVARLGAIPSHPTSSLQPNPFLEDGIQTNP